MTGCKHAWDGGSWAGDGYGGWGAGGPAGVEGAGKGWLEGMEMTVAMYEMMKGWLPKERP